jgi:hypothetical protein
MTAKPLPQRKEKGSSMDGWSFSIASSNRYRDCLAQTLPNPLDMMYKLAYYM